jgi:hypothetical protein
VASTDPQIVPLWPTLDDTLEHARKDSDHVGAGDAAHAEGACRGFVRGARWQRRRIARYLREMLNAQREWTATDDAVLELAVELERD